MDGRMMIVHVCTYSSLLLSFDYSALIFTPRGAGFCLRWQQCSAVLNVMRNLIDSKSLPSRRLITYYYSLIISENNNNNILVLTATAMVLPSHSKLTVSL